MIPVGCLDFETTGVDPENDRIVSAAFVLLDQTGQVHEGRHWLVNPGVPIPAGATEVHGITDEQVQTDGMAAATAVEQIAQALARFVSEEYRHQVGGIVPLVVFNAPYDLTMLDREIKRHEVGLVGDIDGVGGIWWDVAPVIDPLVIDKHVDRYRKGSRKLVDLAQLMPGVEYEGDAHNATADAVTAGRIAQRMLQHTALNVAGSTTDLAALHTAQIGWAREQATSFADYLHSIGAHEKALTVRGSWPYFDGTDDDE